MFRINKYFLLVCMIGQPLIATADYEKGMAAAKSGDFISASREFLIEAENGNAQAQLFLAYMYSGLIYGLVPNDEKVNVWLLRAAELGNADAQFNLAQRYEFGRGMDKDMELSVKWLRKAVEQDHPGAQHWLGSNYVNGEGVERNLTLANEWYRKSAENGEPMGQMDLGLGYGFGDGKEQDIIRGYAWLKLASSQSFPMTEKAQNGMAILLKKMSSEQISEANDLSDVFQQEIAKKNTSRPESDLEIIIRLYDTKSTISNGDPLSHRGFIVVPPVGAEIDDITDKNRAKYTSSAIVKMDDETALIILVDLINLEQKIFTNPSELFDFVKKEKVASRVVYNIRKLQEGVKYKYKKDTSNGRVCVRYEMKGGSNFPALRSDLSLRYYGPYQFGVGLLCIHPNDPSVLVKTEYREFVAPKKQKLFRSKNKKEIRKRAEEFFDSITFTQLQ